MRIAFVAGLVPYKENYNGTSALPYHILKYRPKGIQIDCYLFNGNKLPTAKIKDVEKELDVNIQIIKRPVWFSMIVKLHLLFIRIFFKYPLHNYLTIPQKNINEIRKKNFDGIWVYGEEHSRIVNQFRGFRRVHTLPDSEALYYHRMLGTRFVMNNMMKYWRCAFMYPKFRHLERDFDRDKSIHYHLVGEADAAFLRDMAPGIQAHFIRHPHYEVKEQSLEGHFHTPIRLLIAGQYNYYMKQDADELVNALANPDNYKQLKDAYQITFLGHGWEQHVKTLKRSGWNAQQITFAPDYIDEITKHDIQISPISIGTGTKGKVLDALANGLLVIGTPYAMENIAVEDKKSCLIYHTAEDVIKILKDIYRNPKAYEDIAANGKNRVLKEHDRKTISEELFSLFK